MSIELKIKSKHLSLEAGVIRFEENKLKKQAKWLRDNQKNAGAVESTLNSLNSHRKWDVRNENRATFLARAYIGGKSYKTVEATVKDTAVLTYYIVPRILSMVQKYHSRSISQQDILNWINAGMA